LSVVASFLNGSSRLRLAHEIQLFKAASAWCGQLLATPVV
jgi:hypothetical protein